MNQLNALSNRVEYCEAGVKPMSFIQVLAVASLLTAAFVFSYCIMINNLLMEWKDEF
jgi:hypothetical protein